MKRTACRVRFCDKGSNDAVIGSRKPRANRNDGDQATRSCSHSGLNRRAHAIPQILSFTSVIGAAPVAVISGGEIGAPVSDEISCTPEYLIRVAINIAVNKSAAARK